MTYLLTNLLTNLASAGRAEAITGQQGVREVGLRALEHAKQLRLNLHGHLAHRHQSEASLNALIDTARALAEAHDFGALLETITRRARLLLGLDVSCIALAAEGCALRVYAAHGHISAFTVGIRLSAEHGLGNQVLASSAPAWTPDYFADDGLRRDEILDELVRAEGLRACIAVPLNYNQCPVGVLFVAGRSVRHFTPDELALMNSLADLSGAALENAQLLEQAARDASELEKQMSRIETELNEARELSEMQHHLIELALNGGDLSALAEAASKQLDGALRVIAVDGTVLASTGVVPEQEERTVTRAKMEAQATGQTVQVGDTILVAPVVANNEALGFVLLLSRRPIIDRERRLLRLVAQTTAVLLRLHKQCVVEQGQLREELLTDLLTRPLRSRQQLAQRARRIGFDLNKSHVVVLVCPEDGSQVRAGTWADSYTRRLGGLKTLRDGCVVLLLPGENAGAAAQAVADELSPLLGHLVTAGAAGPVADPSAVLSAYWQAKRCLGAMTALGATGRAASARDLGFSGMLLSGDYNVEDFIDSTIGPLLQHDHQHFTDLTRTLQVYFETGGSPMHAARKLHVHANTVARRLKQISELLGSDWREPEQALEIQLALRLLRITHILRERHPVEDDIPDRDTTA
ncbi:MAG TPA: helix-turn-helix domain-containing protein [Micromonosporaceae bacterium]|nr:helix-turn-helix domain-containing protein [Micromonosporaceae bacterium]